MKKNHTRKLVTIAVAAVVGVLLGVLTRNSLGLGKKHTPPPAEEVTDGGGSAGSAGKKLTALEAGGEDEESQMREALKLESRAKRLLWFAAQAENADAEGLARLMRLSGTDMEVRKMLATRWAELDPQHMFDTLSPKWKDTGRYGYRIMRILVEAWAKRAIRRGWLLHSATNAPSPGWEVPA